MASWRGASRRRPASPLLFLHVDRRRAGRHLQRAGRAGAVAGPPTSNIILALVAACLLRRPGQGRPARHTGSAISCIRSLPGAGGRGGGAGALPIPRLFAMAGAAAVPAASRLWRSTGSPNAPCGCAGIAVVMGGAFCCAQLGGRAEYRAQLLRHQQGQARWRRTARSRWCTAPPSTAPSPRARAARREPLVLLCALRYRRARCSRPTKHGRARP